MSIIGGNIKHCWSACWRRRRAEDEVTRTPRRGAMCGRVGVRIDDGPVRTRGR